MILGEEVQEVVDVEMVADVVEEQDVAEEEEQEATATTAMEMTTRHLQISTKERLML